MTRLSIKGAISHILILVGSSSNLEFLCGFNFETKFSNQFFVYLYEVKSIFDPFCICLVLVFLETFYSGIFVFLCSPYYRLF